MRPRGQIFALWDSDKDRTKKRAGGAKKHKVGGAKKHKASKCWLGGWEATVQVKPIMRFSTFIFFNVGSVWK